MLPIHVADTFEDISTTAWYYADVAAVIELGLMGGVTEDNWAPKETATRAQLATILNRLSGGVVATTTSEFMDVVDNAWYSNAINWAVGSGIYGGFEDGTFRPNDEVTREQLATILYNFARAEAKDISSVGNVTSFVDGTSVSSWANTAMEWAVGTGIIGGKDGNQLDPQGTATRAEIAAMINRFATNYGY